MKGVSQLMLDKISKEQFLSMNAISEIDVEIEKGLIEAYRSKCADKLEEFIYLTFVYEVFEIKYADVLNELLISDWHYQHENIVLLLQRISSVESLEYLYNAMDLHLQYLEWDDNYAFEVKCVRAIYQIGKEKSVPYLKELCRHPNSIIRKTAQRQIEKMV